MPVMCVCPPYCPLFVVFLPARLLQIHADSLACARVHTGLVPRTNRAFQDATVGGKAIFCSKFWILSGGGGRTHKGHAVRVYVCLQQARECGYSAAAG